MKKKSLLKGLFVSFMLLCSAHTWAYDFEVDNIQYTISSFDDMTVAVSGLTDKSVTDVIIPETVEYSERGFTITGIGTEAFYGYYKLMYITIPNSVTSIGREAFRGCSSLTEINIPDSVTSIGREAFRGCSSITEVTIPNSVTSVGYYAFQDCTSLKKATIGDSVTSIESYTFQGCKSLAEATIGNSVTSIGSYAFYNCTSLSIISLPESLLKISDHAFYNCSSLKELDIPNSVTGLGYEALVGCTGLKYFYISPELNELKELQTTGGWCQSGGYFPLFYTNAPTQMKSIELKDGESTFNVRGYSKYHYGGSGHISTWDDGFPLFSSIDLEYLYVGRPLDEIDTWVDNSCTFKIKRSQPYGTIGTLEIGGYCTDVPYFYQSIENLILGENVEKYKISNIYQGEFTSITCKSTTPPTLTSTFSNNTYLNVILYVPKGSKVTYQSAEGWKNFWNIEEVVISGIDDIVNSRNVIEVGRYTVSGQKINFPQKGINIVRYSDGTTRKILVQ